MTDTVVLESSDLHATPRVGEKVRNLDIFCMGCGSIFLASFKDREQL